MWIKDVCECNWPPSTRRVRGGIVGSQATLERGFVRLEVRIHREVCPSDMAYVLDATVLTVSTPLPFPNRANNLLYLLNNLISPVRFAEDVVLMIISCLQASFGSELALTIPADFLQNKKYKGQ